jgi:hypothetical protein
LPTAKELAPGLVNSGLARPTKAGAIRGASDLEAVLYAKLIHGFGASFAGRGEASIQDQSLPVSEWPTDLNSMLCLRSFEERLIARLAASLVPEPVDREKNHLLGTFKTEFPFNGVTMRFDRLYTQVEFEGDFPPSQSPPE